MNSAISALVFTLGVASATRTITTTVENVPPEVSTVTISAVNQDLTTYQYACLYSSAGMTAVYTPDHFWNSSPISFTIAATISPSPPSLTSKVISTSTSHASVARRHAEPAAAPPGLPPAAPPPARLPPPARPPPDSPPKQNPKPEDPKPEEQDPPDGPEVPDPKHPDPQDPPEISDPPDTPETPDGPNPNNGGNNSSTTVRLGGGGSTRTITTTTAPPSCVPFSFTQGASTWQMSFTFRWYTYSGACAMTALSNNSIQRSCTSRVVESFKRRQGFTEVSTAQGSEVVGGPRATRSVTLLVDEKINVVATTTTAAGAAATGPTGPKPTSTAPSTKGAAGRVGAGDAALALGVGLLWMVLSF